MNFFSDHDVYGQTVKFLRSNIPSVHDQFRQILTDLTEAEIRRSFIAVEANQYRVRRIP